MNFCVLCGTSDGWGVLAVSLAFLAAGRSGWSGVADTRSDEARKKDGDADASCINKIRSSSGKNTAVARESDDDDDHINHTSRSPKHRMERKMRETAKHRYTHSPEARLVGAEGIIVLQRCMCPDDESTDAHPAILPATSAP